MKEKIGIIGAGNMAQAIVLGLLDNNYHCSHITISNRSAERLKFFDKLQLKTTQQNTIAIKNADIVIIAVKPNQVASVCHEIAASLDKACILVSVAANISSNDIEQFLGREHPIICAMPNLGVSVSAGVTGLYANTSVTEAQMTGIETLFAALGMVVWLEEESLLSSVIAVSGSGIAYYFRFMEIMQQKAIQLGLPADIAKFMVAETVLGAAKLGLESEADFASLRQQVTSPGGTTARALAVMEQKGIAALIAEAMRATTQHV